MHYKTILFDGHDLAVRQASEHTSTKMALKKLMSRMSEVDRFI